MLNIFLTKIPRLKYSWQLIANSLQNNLLNNLSNYIFHLRLIFLIKQVYIRISYPNKFLGFNIVLH